MKKTFTINISGSVFHIEENAFEKLQDYLQLLTRYFGIQEGGQEILQDIESRIAELLQIREGKPVLHVERKLRTNREGFHIYSTIYFNSENHTIFGSF